jgi:hypothetical protein
LCVHAYVCVCVCVSLGGQPRALSMVGKCSTTEIHPQTKETEYISFLSFSFLIYFCLGMGPMAMLMLGKHATTELLPQPLRRHIIFF